MPVCKVVLKRCRLCLFVCLFLIQYISNGKKYIQKIKNNDIRQRSKLTDTLKHALKMKWQWAGHIARIIDKRWTVRTPKWTGPLGKRNVGRPKKRWADGVISVAGEKWRIMAKNRKNGRKWRRLLPGLNLNHIIIIYLHKVY